VRYIAAIDRRNSVEHAMQTVDIAIRMKKTGLVVGVDLSGDGSVSINSLCYMCATSLLYAIYVACKVLFN